MQPAAKAPDYPLSKSAQLENFAQQKKNVGMCALSTAHRASCFIRYPNRSDISRPPIKKIVRWPTDP